MKKRGLFLIVCIAMLSALLFVLPANAADDDPFRSQFRPYWPVPGHNRLSQQLHGGNAIDISDAHIEGADVIAARGGVVQYVFKCNDNHEGEYGECCYGFGNGVVILGIDGRSYQYAHMEAGSIPENIRPGIYVSRGTVIGRVGNTGNSTGPHLHFGISNTVHYWEEGPDPSTIEYDYVTDTDEPLDLGDEFFARMVCTSNDKALTANGINIILADDDYQSDQRLKFVRQEDGSYHIHIYFSDYAFTLADANDADSIIDLEPDVDAATQSWYIYGNEGSYVLVSKQCGKVVTVSDSGILHLLDDYTIVGYRNFDIQIHKYTDLVVEPTDFEGGYTTHTCNCGDGYTDAVTEKLCPFGDIAPNKWYSEAVMYCFGREYMSGTSRNEFGYKATMDRQMFATILAKIDGSDTSEYTEMSFGDVDAGKWYSESVEWAYRNGYALGIGNDADGTPIYGRKNPVTREQLALFFYTYSKAKGYDVEDRADLSGYSDLRELHSWARRGVEWAVGSGLISGTSRTTLSPRSNATRAEVALIIKNYVETVANISTVN